MRKMLHFMRALGARCILPHPTQGELFLLGGHGEAYFTQRRLAQRCAK